ncbi:23S rRNA pseudouridylate synthase [Brachybacterium endophyticum]|uniref:RNA pseudouridylate synthase n=1 Tax=Brachybacterium endophyticum TaxID=2182385 RepID=A0A2U2RPA9_9MICO|nr:pseudouridine synthase [Brachybacterium endophyticum]PWH07696.1 23S rRNA pseudouridylate synthase [Brachybacterium endophyticum]
MGRAARRRERRAAPPLAQRGGLDPIRWRIGPESALAGTRALEALAGRYPALLDPAATTLEERFAAGDVVRPDGAPWRAEDPVVPGDELCFHRELQDEEVAGEDPPILLRDAHLLVIDKPHEMATMPRGVHVLSSALVRLRRSTGLEDLTPLHRLDRRTAGVLAFGVVPAERSAYHGLFARGEVAKTYLARVELNAGTGIPHSPGERFTMHDRLEKTRGDLRTRAVPGEPNALTEGEVLEVDAQGERAVVRLRPRTGRTHQLRAQLSLRSAPIVGDELYSPAAPGEAALALLAQELAFTDPVTGTQRSFRSDRALP